MSGHDSENNVTTDLDSEAYTTTDIEVGNNNSRNTEFLSPRKNITKPLYSSTSGEESENVGKISEEKRNIDEDKDKSKKETEATESEKRLDGDLNDVSKTIEERLKLESLSPTCCKNGEGNA